MKTAPERGIWAPGPTPRGVELVAQARPVPFWLDRTWRPRPRPRLAEDVETDLLVVGGGFTGLWAAVQAAEENPGRRVVLVERDRIAEHASGRNGGFCAASITHGLGNGLERFPDELPTLLRMGKETLADIADTMQRHRINADAEHTGGLDLANAPWQTAELQTYARAGNELGEQLVYLDRDEARGRVDSPLVEGAVFDPDVMLIDPAKLAWGLAETAERLGVRIYEGTEVTDLRRAGGQLHATTGYGRVVADNAILATSASRSLVRRLRLFTVPVWDYALMTEPLTAQQLSAIGWAGREGLADSGPRFHYFRLTADNRILFGGWDPVYRFASGTARSHEFDPAEFAMLGEHLLQMFPQLAGIRASHAWGGAIDTCSRFCAFWDRSHDDTVVTVVGFTGLGVGASYFGARTALDLVDGLDTERTRLQMVRSKPLPFPPEPLRWIGINLTMRAIARSERRDGKRGAWLTLMDKTGLGFDS